MPTPTRRDFVRLLALGAGATAVGAALPLEALEALEALARPPRAATEHPGWDLVPHILGRIRPPRFPARTFDVTRYGAVGDGARDCGDAFRKAIDACHAAGGGRVLVQGGRFLTGPIHLRSNVELHVAKGATIAFVRDPRRYLPQVLTRFEGVELMNYSPFIYAFGEHDIAITGEGTLDGQADCEHWWRWKGTAACNPTRSTETQGAARARLVAMAEQGVPVGKRVFGEGDYLRPQFIQPYRCRNVLIEDVHITNSPMWEIHPVLCQNVTVRRVSISTHGPNNDGCDPESCRDVLIEDCFFDTGDDCIAIKSGRNADGRRINVPSENIIVRGCHMKDGHGGVSLGSELSGGIRNVFVERCRMDSPHLERMLRLKTNAMRGGVLEHVYVRDVTVGQVASAVLQIDFYYEEADKGDFMPVVRDVELRRVTSQRSEYALDLRGFAQAPIRDVRVVDCDFRNVARPNVVERVEGLTLRDVTINGRRATA